tara:strand:- start:45 stop:482 length:438 start_codon:yes stop_codon:yes gene_type:complete
VTPLFPDLVNGLTIAERLAHAQLMVTVASIDGELVQEELIIIESIMGKSMLHPEMRVDVRNSLNHPLEVEKCMDILSSAGQKLALRDAVLVSACDGEYDKKEIRIIKKIARIAEVDTDTLSQIYHWVEEYWSVYNKSTKFLASET